jgi:hypothetical protein
VNSLRDGAAYGGAMFSIEREYPGYIRVRATGRLSWRDYDRFEPDFAAELALRQAQDRRDGGQRTALLLDVRGWRGWTAGGLVRDIFFNLSNRNTFPRIGVVGDRPWHKWLTYAAKPVFTCPMRYFDAGREGEAVEWVSGFGKPTP